MAEPSSHILELAKRGAALRFREIAHELDLLLELFPDLHDSFDADELPVSFIVKRDARRTGAVGSAQQRPSPAAARKAVNRRMTQAWTQRRAGSRS